MPNAHFIDYAPIARLGVVVTTLASVSILGSSPTLAQDEAGPAPPPEPRWDMVAFEVKSWGEPVTSWRVSSAGFASWTETRKEDGDALGEYTLVWHEIPDAIRVYIGVEDIFARLPATAPDQNTCTNMMTDLPYGTLRMTKGSTTVEYEWNSGCMDDDYAAFIAILKEADTLVAEAGRKAPVQREETYPSVK